MAFGHTFGVKVNGPPAQRVWPPNGGRLCSLALRGRQPYWAEGSGGGFAADYKDQTFATLGAKDRQTYEPDRRRPVHLKNLPLWTLTQGALHLISNPVFRCIQGTSIL